MTSSKLRVQSSKLRAANNEWRVTSDSCLLPYLEGAHMSAERPAIDVAKVEELLGQVRGVMAVRVVLEEGGQIDELHIVGSPGRSAKQMVRDVESLLYVRGGVRVDHRKISLVQIAESAIQPAQVRIRLLDISHTTGDQATVTVVLGMDEQRVQGIGHSRPD